MKRIWAIPAILMMLLMLGACGLSRADREVESALVRADSLIESRPDSALAILTAIDHSAIRSDALRARYALGLYHARLKNYLPLESDSLVNFAVDYYTTHSRGNAENLMRAFYYQSCAQLASGNYPAATYSALQTDEIATRLNLLLWRARANDCLGIIANNTYNPEEEIARQRIAAALYYEIDSVRNAQCCLMDVASAISQNGENWKGILLLDSVYPTIPHQDSLRIGYAALIYTQLYESKGDGAKAEEWLRLAKKCGFMSPTAENLFYEANVVMLNNDLDSVWHIVSQISKLTALDKNPMVIKLPQFKYLYATENYKEACDTLMSLFKEQNEYMRLRARQSTIVAQRDYEVAMRKESARVLELTRFLWILSAVALLIVLSVVIVYFLYRIRTKNAQVKLAKEDILKLTSQLEFEGTDSRKNKEISHAARTLQALLLSYLPQGEHWTQKSGNEFIQCLSSDDYLESLVSTIDSLTSDLFARIKTQVPDIKDKEIHMLALLYSGFSQGAVCGILGLSMPNFYTRKSRIRKKIQDSQAIDADEFLKILSLKS